MKQLLLFVFSAFFAAELLFLGSHAEINLAGNAADDLEATSHSTFTGFSTESGSVTARVPEQEGQFMRLGERSADSLL